jgi:hypothetical protein
VGKSGEYIVGANTVTLTPANSTFSVTGDRENFNLVVAGDGDFYSVEIAAPRGEELRRGSFAAAERVAFRTGRAPGVDVSGNGRGCNETWGSFIIRQVEFNELGIVSKFDATITQKCDSSAAPALTVTVLYNAEPWQFTLTSTAGDYVGQGVKRTYLGNTSDFVLNGTTQYLTYGVSGLRDDWLAVITPPNGQQLAVGTYPTQRFAGPDHAGLDFFGNGRGCNQSTGTLNIKGIETDAEGDVTALYALITQYCDGSTVPLKGTIRYHK